MSNTKLMLVDGLGWGFLLWFIGYILGIVFFMFLPPNMIGWAIMPIGLAMTLWVLMKKVKAKSFREFMILAFVWTFLAVFLDYFLLVKVFKPVDGYYKLDVYFYYLSTFTLPLMVWFVKKFELLNN
ncbi:MAG: hypothetical protein U0525_04015 [Patescibacteria group bacterium]